MGHYTSNEMMAHGARTSSSDLVQFVFSVLPNYPNDQIYAKFELPTQNSFSVKIIFVTYGRARF